MTTMRAVRTVGAGELEYVELPRPSVGAGEALVQIEYVTLCGTDLHIFHDEYASELPLIQGHELSGTVVATAPDVDRVRVGDRVAIDPLINCGDCAACRQGRGNVCPHQQVLGCYCDGGFSEYLAVSARKVHRIPDLLATELGAVAEPTAISLEAVRRGRAAAGETALVLGAGPIGLLATLILRDVGLTVVAADTLPHRLSMAREFGASHTLLIDPNDAFPSAELAAAIGGTAPNGPQLVIEATGIPSSQENAMYAVAPAGRVVQVGISTQQTQFPLSLLPFKEIDLLGSRNSQGLIPEALEIIPRYPETVRNLITHSFGSRELGTAFTVMADPTQRVGKILINMADLA